MSRRWWIGAAALAASLAVAAPAGAAESAGTVVLIPASSSRFPDVAYVVQLPTKRNLTAADVKVVEDGKQVTGVAVAPASGATGIGTVLLIDASNSMKGSIGEAMAAAREYAKRTAGQPLSVVFFNSQPSVRLPFTVDPKTIQQALAGNPKLAEGTRLYDALSAAVAQIRDSGLGAGRIILVSDGADVGSLTSKDGAIAQLQDQRIRAYTVGITSRAFSPDDMQQIADATGATFANADKPTDLSGLYAALGSKLSNEHLILYRSGARPNEKVTVTVAVTGIPETATTTYETPATGTGAPYKEKFADKFRQSWLLMLLFVFFVVSLLAYAVHTLWQLRTNRRLRRRLGDFVALPEEERAKERQREVREQLAATAGHAGKPSMLQRLNWYKRFEADIDVGGITTPPQHLLALSVIVGLLVALVCAAAFGPWWSLLGIAVPIIMRAEVGRRATRVRNDFQEQLPDNLEVMASALRAGHSLIGAMAVMRDEAAEPSKSEFSRVVLDEQLGVLLDDALEVTARRMQSSDMEQVALLAMLQREAGGNMAEVLDQVVANVRARMDYRRLVRVLTAQGRLARWIITGIPIVLIFVIFLMNPDQLKPLVETTLGIVAIVLATIGVIVGSYMIKRIVAIEL
jgi:tight adherence protein B